MLCTGNAEQGEDEDVLALEKVSTSSGGVVEGRERVGWECP